MAINYGTVNTITTKSGTGWTIDVTTCNLLADLTVKDFVVLIGGVLANNSLFTKTSRTVLTYGGADIGTNITVEVRRKTPTDILQPITYNEKFFSAVWNSELERINRRANEYDVNGVGAGSVVDSVVPDNSPYGVAWSGDTVKPPTRKAVYDKVQTLAPLASPVFSGTPTAPTPALTTDNTQLATAALVWDSNRQAFKASVGAGGFGAVANVDTVLVFNTTLLDTDSRYNNTNGRFTPTVSATYMVCWSIRFTNLSGADRLASLIVDINGSMLSYATNVETLYNGMDTKITGCEMVGVNANQYLALRYRVNGAGVNIGEGSSIFAFRLNV